MSTEQKKSTEVAKKKQSDITSIVLKKVEAFQNTGELRLPADYSPENALKSAQLILGEQKDRNGNSVLQSCTQASIANALLKTVVWGLSPLKAQVYYIPYGDKLECSIAYTGNITIAKRYGNLKSIKANCIMEGDEFEFEIDSATALKKIITHKQTLDSIGSSKIRGAYALYELNDGTIDVEIMNMSQIQSSWEQGATKGKSPAHTKFPGEMAKKTVINRACKLLIRSSDDKILYDEEDKDMDYTKANVDQEIKDNANGDYIDIDSEDVSDDLTQENKSAEEKKQPAKEVITEKSKAEDKSQKQF